MCSLKAIDKHDQPDRHGLQCMKNPFSIGTGATLIIIIKSSRVGKASEFVCNPANAYADVSCKRLGGSKNVDAGEGRAQVRRVY